MREDDASSLSLSLGMMCGMGLALESDAALRSLSRRRGLRRVTSGGTGSIVPEVVSSRGIKVGG